MEGLLRLLLFLFFPQLLGFLVVFLKALYNWKRHVIFFRPTGSLEKLLLAGLLARSCWLLYRTGAEPEPLYFAKTQTPVDAQAYMIRNHFRSYVERREAAEPHFAEMMRIRREQLGTSTDPEEMGRLYSRHVDLEREYIQLERLSMELRAKEYRRRYVLFGPEAPECELCGGDGWLYVGLVAPTVLREYLVMLLLVGLVSMWTTGGRKGAWRGYAVGVLALLLAYEGMEWGLSEELSTMLGQLGSGPGNYLTRPEQLQQVRSLVLGLLGLLVVLVDFVPAEDVELVGLLLTAKAVEETTATLQATRLTTAAILGNDALRRSFVEHYKRNEYDRSRMVADPLYGKLTSELLLHYRPAGIVEDALRVAAVANKKQD